MTNFFLENCWTSCRNTKSWWCHVPRLLPPPLSSAAMEIPPECGMGSFVRTRSCTTSWKGAHLMWSRCHAYYLVCESDTFQQELTALLDWFSTIPFFWGGECASWWWGGTEGERDSLMLSMEPNAGLDLITLRSWPEQKSRVGCLKKIQKERTNCMQRNGSSTSSCIIG